MRYSIEGFAEVQYNSIGLLRSVQRTSCIVDYHSKLRFTRSLFTETMLYAGKQAMLIQVFHNCFVDDMFDENI